MNQTAKLQQLLQEAVAHHRAGRLERAEAAYRSLAGHLPRHAQLCDLRGQLAHQRGRPAEAIRFLAEAVELDGGAAPYATRLASLLLEIGRGAEAEQVLRRLTERVPAGAAGWNALGFVLKARGRWPEALACHERALQLDPRLVEAWYHHGHTLASAGHSQAALASYERALERAPDFLPARFGRAQALQKCYRLPEALAEYDAVLRADPRHHEARSCRLFALQNTGGLGREQLWEEHRTYGKMVGTGPAACPAHDATLDRRLRVAILSPDLRRHSCAYFLEPLVRHLDRQQCELFLYHDHPQEDEVSRRLRAGAACWRNFGGQSHAAVESVVRGDRPDILIDLAGHIGTTIRLPLLARRLAPVQITYLGYPDTTGVPAMDFRLTDAWADPVGESDRFCSERLVRLAPTAWAYQPPAEAPAVAPLPFAGGAPITFGCFNNPAKFTDELFAVWARLLAAVPDSRLLLKGRDFEQAPVRERMLRRLQTQGVAEGRVKLLARTPETAGHLTLYSRVDLALDTFPYHGTTTTCEALWMGVPVVSWAGTRHASRVGVSLLHAVGHPEWIAHDEAEYLRIAAGLVADRATLAATRAGLRSEVARSPLLDHGGRAAEFVRALVACWREKMAAGAAASLAA